MTSLKHLLKKHLSAVLSLAFLIIFGTTLHIMAAAPVGGYNPGATLDPDCTPGSTDCFIKSTNTIDFSNVTGTVPTVQGGTGLTTLPVDNVLLGNGTATPNFVAPGSTNNVLTSNGTTWVSQAPANNLPAIGTAGQMLGVSPTNTLEYKTLSTGTSGTDFNLDNSTGSLVFNLPDASTTARGLITTGSQTLAGQKTFNDTITLSTAPEFSGTPSNSDDLTNKNYVDTKVNAMAAGLTWQAPVATFSDLATTYPSPTAGWAALTLDTNDEWVYDGTTSTWVQFNTSPTYTAGNGLAVGGNQFSLSAPVSVANGGTGLTTLTSNNLLLGNGTGTPTFIAPGTANNVLTSNGTTWVSQAPTSGGITSINGNSTPAQLITAGAGIAFNSPTPGTTVISYSGGVGGSGTVISGLTENYLTKSDTNGDNVINSQVFDNGTDVGIGTSTPGAKLDVEGNIKIADGTQGLGKVLTSDADGLASWQTPSGGGSGVSSLNTLTGALSLAAGSGISITPSSGTLTIANTGGGGSGWSLTGNAGTVDGTDFIGTTDNVPLTFKVNNVQAGRIDDTLENTFLGYQAGIINTTGSYNTANGWQALYSNTTGGSNVAIGAGALQTNTTGDGNIAMGYSALQTNTTGNFDVAIGIDALNANNANANVAIGYYTLESNTTGSDNTATGYSALQDNTIGNNNTANGISALISNTTGSDNTATGYAALQANTANYNTANGDSSLFSNTTGDYNTANGDSALYSNTTGTNNTADGAYALRLNTIGSYNTANGENSLTSNTTGNNNTANGEQALYSNTTGTNNMADGYSSLFSNTTGDYNTANGDSALYSNTTGTNNTADGDNAMLSNTTGNFNTANGNNALYSDATGTDNTSSGAYAGYLNTAGSDNVFLGYGAGYYETGDNHLWIDNQSRASLVDGQTKALLYGTFDAAPANQRLVLNGQLQITQGNPGAGKVLTSDANGLADWETPSSNTPTLTQNQIAYGDASNQMTSSPDLTFDGNDFKISTSSTYPDGFLEILDNGGQLKLGDYTNDFHGTYFQINDYVPSMKVYSTWPTFAGIQYNADYSANYTARSLVDKNYVDTHNWSLTGNAGTVDGTDFIGTTDNVPLTFRVDNVLAGRIDATLGSSFFGYQAGVSNTTGSDNTAEGYQALHLNTTGSQDTAIGNEALYSNTTGYSNVAEGQSALYFNTTGVYNTANGMKALYLNTTGNGNVANGGDTLYSNTTGGDNVANGPSTLYANTTGSSNTANGGYALATNTTGGNNTADGMDAGYSDVSGSDNVFLGYQAGYYETGNNHLWIDNQQRSSLADAQTKALMYGTFDASVADQSLRINGDEITAGATASDGMQTSAGPGTGVVINNNVRGLYYDPAAVVANETITLPSVPRDGQEILIMFGGQLTNDVAVVNSLTISPNAGQSLVNTNDFPALVHAGKSYEFKYRSATSQWYEIRSN